MDFSFIGDVKKKTVESCCRKPEIHTVGIILHFYVKCWFNKKGEIKLLTKEARTSLLGVHRGEYKDTPSCYVSRKS